MLVELSIFCHFSWMNKKHCILYTYITDESKFSKLWDEIVERKMGENSSAVKKNLKTKADVLLHHLISLSDDPFELPVDLWPCSIPLPRQTYLQVSHYFSWDWMKIQDSLTSSPHITFSISHLQYTILEFNHVNSHLQYTIPEFNHVNSLHWLLRLKSIHHVEMDNMLVIFCTHIMYPNESVWLSME